MHSKLANVEMCLKYNLQNMGNRGITVCKIVGDGTSRVKDENFVKF